MEQRLREEEEIRMQRMLESAQMSEWLAKDGDFQLEQERKRASIRILEKRAKAIDFLSLNLKYASSNYEEDGSDDAGLEIDLDEPYNIFEVSLRHVITCDPPLNSHRFRTFQLNKWMSCMTTSNDICP
jgi:hypothetical protein